MHINKSMINEDLPCFSYFRSCNCDPKVSLPSIKGPIYWSSPNFIPSIYKAKAQGNTKTPGTNILSQSTIDHCMKKYMYLWFNNGTEFWSVPISVVNNDIYLWIWNSNKWTYYTMPLNNINCFICYWYTSLVLKWQHYCLSF